MQNPLLAASCPRGSCESAEKEEAGGRAAAPEPEGRWERAGAQDCMRGAARAAGLGKGAQAYADASPCWSGQEQIHLRRQRLLLSQRKP